MNYRQYQQVFQIKEGGNVVKRPGKVIKRSFYGCFNCKKKKKKCDETKPVCNNCTKSRLECYWPRNPQEKAKKNDLGCTGEFGGGTQNVGSESQVSETIKSGTIKSETSSSEFNQNDIPMNPDSYGINEESLMYTCFVNEFLPSILPPHVRRYKLASHTFIVAAQESHTLKDIYMACGAVLLAFDNERFKEIARRLYTKAVNSLIERMKDNSVKGVEDWLFIAIQSLQTLCLRGGSLGFNATTCAEHLYAAYGIIQRRYKLAASVIREPEGDGGTVGSQIINDGTMNFSLDGHVDSSSLINMILVENFIFNYPVTIMFCQSNRLEKLIPNPFDFFETYKSWLLSTIIDEQNQESTRIFSLTFEIAAKVSWLFRLCIPLNERDLERCKALIQLTQQEVSSLKAKDLSMEDEGLADSIMVARLILQACIMILRKLIDFDSVKVIDMQGELISIIKDIKSYKNDTLIYPVWALIICGSASSSNHQKEFFRSQIEHLMTLIHSNTVLSVMNHLQSAWNAYSDDEVFELLFDSSTLDSIFA